MVAAQLLLILLFRAQNLRMDPLGRTALNQERPLSFKKTENLAGDWAFHRGFAEQNLKPAGAFTSLA
jgi:hypothetical protein